MAIIFDYVAANAASGTELMMRGLDQRLPKDLNDKFSIGRAIGLFKNNPTINIYWTHNLPTQRIIPEIEEQKTLRSPDRWNIIKGVVFVSEWQKQQYINYYNFTEEDYPYLKVIKNAIVPIETHSKPSGKIKLIYTSVPERGLQVLYNVFDVLCKKYDDIELDVYSSYKIYGIPKADLVHKQAIDACINHPKINYHGTVSNSEIREAFKQAHIFAYPSTFLETSCISLIEAMSAGCICVHPDVAALSETAGGHTNMYQTPTNRGEYHVFCERALEQAIEQVRSNTYNTLNQVEFANTAYSWDNRIEEWNDYLSSML